MSEKEKSSTLNFLLMKEIKKKADDTINSSLYRAESLYSSVQTSIEDNCDKVKGIAKGVYGATGSGFFLGFISLGFTASIPISVGIAVLSVIFIFANEEYESQKSDYDQKKSSRVLHDAINFLAKYGKLPEVGVVENEYISISLNSKDMQAEGFFKSGPHEGSYLKDLSLSELGDSADAAPDDQTRALIESYIKFRSRKQS